MFLLDLAIAASGGAPETKVLTSEKLVALKEAMKAAWKAQNAFEDPFDPKAKDAKLAFLKAEGEVKSEESALQKAENDAKLQEAKNARIALNAAQFTAYDALNAVKANKKATPEDLAAAQSAFDTAREAVENELLAKYAGSKPAKTTDGGETTVRDTESKEAILALARAGKTQKEIVEAGHARSTVWHTINKAKIAGETFQNA